MALRPRIVEQLHPARTSVKGAMTGRSGADLRVEGSSAAFTPGAIVPLAERNPRNTSTIEGPERRSRCCSVAGPSSVRKQVWYGSVHGPHRALKPEGHSECGGAGHHFRPEPRSAVLEWKVRVAQCRRYRPERAPCAHLRHRAEGYRPGQ